ncbi:MAG: IgGFc-binding protein [Polyangiaceae bacterium]|nr:IgGFc-binding protein [Polyangiaceae bacterium]
MAPRFPLARSSIASISLASLLGAWACGSAASSRPSDDSAAQAGAGGGGSGGGGGAFQPGGGAGGAPTVIPDPETCEQAALGHTYVGCDFWPTVLDNIVRPDFDYAVVAANAGAQPADVTVERAGAKIGTVTVEPGGLVKMFLPWVPELKSVTSPLKGCPTDVKTATVNAKQGAYHVTSTRPIALYQFNAIEYQGKGGPGGKSWASCQTDTCGGQLKNKCFSYTNDASLLLPSTALTGAYRIAGPTAWQSVDDTSPTGGFIYPPYVAVTATVDGTQVQVKLSATAAIAKGSGLPSIGPGGTATFTLGRGDVALLVGESAVGVDLSGSLVTASAPVQVLSGIACANVPADRVACDHLEESVPPAETLGRRYFVTAPSGPGGASMGHVVRLHGNVDGTKLTYPGFDPGGPATIDAGVTVDLGVVPADFEIVGDHEFLVASYQLGAGPTTGDQLGDPSQSLAVTVEQFRTRYVFLAPDDYDESYADVVTPMTATLTLDGVAITQAPVEISSGYGALRVKLPPGKAGAHVLTSDVPVGLQVIGYGKYTSYQYPGGLNLGEIAPPPVK